MPNFFKSIETNAPSIAKVTRFAPQLTGETGKRTVAVMNLVIPNDSKHSIDALNFALFVTNTENQLNFAKAANVLPSTRKGVEKYLEVVEREKVDSSLSQARLVSAEQLEKAEVLIAPHKDLNQLQKIIYESLQAAMLGDKTVERSAKRGSRTMGRTGLDGIV